MPTNAARVSAERTPHAPIETDLSQSNLSQDVSHLGREIVEVGGVLDMVRDQVEQQLSLFEEMDRTVKTVGEANVGVANAIGTVASRAHEAKQQLENTVSAMHSSSQRTQNVASWVAELSKRMRQIDITLQMVQQENTTIADIARQVHLLAINAKIEATRAGQAGVGFGVVAQAINELSLKTSTAAGAISTKMQDLEEQVADVVKESSNAGKEAGSVLAEIKTTDAALEALSTSITETQQDADQINTHAQEVQDALQAFEPAFHSLSEGFSRAAHEIHEATRKSDTLIDRSERIVQATFALGGASQDHDFVHRVTEDAARLSEILESAVARGEISIQDLFDTRYRKITGTDPQQFMLPVVRITDKYFPEVQEAALASHRQIVFCAAVNKDGFLPTHNKKFSQPQGRDPVWNASHSRNRRIFDDRVGRKAGQNTNDFLLQVYRRDLGGGTFKIMKDLSAPIFVHGRHWGGLRLAYTFD